MAAAKCEMDQIKSDSFLHEAKRSCSLTKIKSRYGYISTETRPERRGERDAISGCWLAAFFRAFGEKSAARWHSVTPRERERVSQTAQVQVQRRPAQVSGPEEDERYCCGGVAKETQYLAGSVLELLNHNWLFALEDN
ncbi:hypothetical protein ROHU_029172 [Labeo rohita]|uniref:Uncharacterized protein n=1 Tax=Labeo rohita TaxID=84645 RepID=A0A498M690_LABRO|nr:hypothetical protein ROHU_029172 [Labeo rohita]